ARRAHQKKRRPGGAGAGALARRVQHQDPRPGRRAWQPAEGHPDQRGGGRQPAGHPAAGRDPGRGGHRRPQLRRRQDHRLHRGGDACRRDHPAQEEPRRAARLRLRRLPRAPPGRVLHREAQVLPARLLALRQVRQALPRLHPFRLHLPLAPV
ncbi:MAG: Mobile element protein, partial [uncultured Thermomicrobiales bacterium]